MVWIELGLYGVMGAVFLVILARNAHPMRGSITRQRKALAERIGSWLADQGHGRVVEQGWGKLGG